MDYRQLVIRMSVEDYDALTLAAANVGTPASTYARYIVMRTIRAEAEAHAKEQARIRMEEWRMNRKREREIEKKHIEGARAAGRARRAAEKQAREQALADKRAARIVEREAAAKAKRMAKQRKKFGWTD